MVAGCSLAARCLPAVYASAYRQYYIIILLTNSNTFTLL